MSMKCMKGKLNRIFLHFITLTERLNVLMKQIGTPYFPWEVLISAGQIGNPGSCRLCGSVFHSPLFDPGRNLLWLTKSII